MTTFLFWNINKKPLAALLRLLVDEYAPDVLALAECSIAVDVLLDAVNANGAVTYRISPDPAGEPASRLVLLTRLPHAAITALVGNTKCAVRHIKPPLSADLLLVALHLISKLHTNGGEQEQAMLATRLRPLIDDAERQVGHQRAVVMGDLNMSPFESGVTSSETLHAVTERHSALKRSRTVQGQERFFFYNPLPGQLAAAAAGPPGTYYRPATGTAPASWHIYDQVLIRPDLLANFSDEDLSVLTRAGPVSLLNKSGRPDRRVGSDHLPLLLKI